MPSDPNECREHAKECLHWAMTARSSYACERFEELAKMWIRLAVAIERTESFADDWPEFFPKDVVRRSLKPLRQ